MSGGELAGFRELAPEPRWSEEDFLQRFGHHLRHSTHAQAFADLDLDNDRLLSHEVGLSLSACLPLYCSWPPLCARSDRSERARRRKISTKCCWSIWT